MKKLITLALLACTLIGCHNGYARAVRNYNGDLYREKTTGCTVNMVHDINTVNNGRVWLEQHRFNEVGYTCWSAKPGWTELHAEKLCRKLGGDHILFFKGNINLFAYTMNYTPKDAAVKYAELRDPGIQMTKFQRGYCAIIYDAPIR